MAAGHDPSVTFRWIGDDLLRGQGEQSAAILVVDFAGSTARKARSPVPLLALEHILFHNLLGVRAVARDAECKLTGDGCILCFPVARFESTQNACAAAASEAMGFSEEVLHQNSVLREALDGSQWGIRTKCALHFGGVYLVDYTSLYELARTHPGLGNLFPPLPDGRFSSTSADPHGEAVDLAFRVLGHCKEGQLLASEEFVTALGQIQDSSPFVLADEHVAVHAKGAPNDEIRVQEVSGRDSHPKGVSPSEHIDWDAAKPLCEALKLADDSLNQMLGVSERHRVPCEDLINHLQPGHSVTDNDWPNERESLYKFIVVFTTRARESSPALPASLSEQHLGVIVGKLDEILRDFGVDLSAWCREPFDMNGVEDLHSRTEAVATAMKEFLGAGSISEETVRRRIIEDALPNGLGLGALADAAARYLTAVRHAHIVLRHVIDATMRTTLGLAPGRIRE